MNNVHAYLSVIRRAVSQAQREEITSRGITWEIPYQARQVAGKTRLALELWGPRNQLQLLVTWMGRPAQNMDPIVCAAFNEDKESEHRGKRIRGVPINLAAWLAVAPDIYNAVTETMVRPTTFQQPRGFLGRPALRPDEVED